MIGELGFWPLVIGFVVSLFAVLKKKPPGYTMDIPSVRYSRYLPDFVNGLVFYAVGAKLIDDAYEKVCSLAFFAWEKEAVTDLLFSTRIPRFACSRLMAT